VGDTFSIHVLNEVLMYQVNQILIVTPDDTNELNIVADMDYCTLITCTPYGINSHRMLVRGVRIENIEEAMQTVILPEARKISTEWSLIVSIAVAVIFISVACLLYFVFKLFKKLGKKIFKK
jgi:sortase A